MGERKDPIRERYFKPLERAERAAAVAFYIAAILSLTVLLKLVQDWPQLYAGLQIAFLVVSLISFGLGTAIRLYLAPRAERRRREDFLSNSLSVPLTHERTTGYYNNDEPDPDRRLGLNLLENALHTKDTAAEMCVRERWLTAVYGISWIILASVRATGLEWIVIAAQVLFSEQLVSRYFRLEWLRGEVERVYDVLARALRTVSNTAALRPIVLEQLVAYESAKARAGITLSTRIFQRRNQAVSAEWSTIKATLSSDH